MQLAEVVSLQAHKTSVVSDTVKPWVTFLSIADLLTLALGTFSPFWIPSHGNLWFTKTQLLITSV